MTADDAQSACGLLKTFTMQRWLCSGIAHRQFIRSLSPSTAENTTHFGVDADNTSKYPTESVPLKVVIECYLKARPEQSRWRRQRIKSSSNQGSLKLSPSTSKTSGMSRRIIQRTSTRSGEVTGSTFIFAPKPRELSTKAKGHRVPLLHQQPMSSIILITSFNVGSYLSKSSSLGPSPSLAVSAGFRFNMSA